MRAHLPTHSNDNTWLFQSVTLQGASKHKESSVSNRGAWLHPGNTRRSLKTMFFGEYLMTWGKVKGMKSRVQTSPFYITRFWIFRKYISIEHIRTQAKKKCVRGGDNSQS